MMPEILLVLSPLIFVFPRQHDASVFVATTGSWYRCLSEKASRLLMFFLQPHSMEEAILAGHTAMDIQQAMELGLLVRATDPTCAAQFLWEERNWSRLGYLLFSQMDLPYLEPVDSDLSIDSLTEFRRNVITNYARTEAYPERYVPDGCRIVTLSRPDIEASCDLDALFRRRCVRRFSDSPIPLSVFSDLVFRATRNIRTAEAAQSAGDLYQILNSFYSWLEVYVIVQEVEGLPRCVAYYDPVKHALHVISEPISDAEIAATIQHQLWISGGGFCVYAVVNWQRYMWVYRHSRAYLNLLVQLGEFGQEVIQSAYHLGLGGWMTPAITESAAAKLLQIDPIKRDAMYFLKIGPPSSPE